MTCPSGMVISPSVLAGRLYSFISGNQFPANDAKVRVVDTHEKGSLQDLRSFCEKIGFVAYTLTSIMEDCRILT